MSFQVIIKVTKVFWGFLKILNYWLERYMLLRKTTINTKHCSFQYRILNNVLYLNKLFLKFGKVNSPLFLSCKSAEETIIYLVNVYVHNIYGINFRSSFRLHYYPRCYTAECHSWFYRTGIEHFLLINHLLLIYKCYLYKARETQKI